MATFWSDARLDPKRQYRFKVTFGNGDTGVEEWLIKTVTKPSVTVSSTSHVYLTHTFNFPGKVTWDDITMTLVDGSSTTGGTTGNLIRFLGKAGYTYPTDQNKVNKTISKFKTKQAVPTIVIKQIDADGTPVETWTLHNPIITKISNGNLSYASEDLVELSLTIKYDWAELEKVNI